MKQAIKTCMDSFKDKALLAKVFAFDLLLALSIYIIFPLSEIAIKPKAQALAGISLGDIAQKSIGSLKSDAYLMKSFVAALILTLVGAFVFFIIAYSIFEGLAWLSIMKKKFNIAYLLKFSLLNLIWFILSALLIFIVLAGLGQAAFKIAIPLAALVILYLTMLLGCLFAKDPKFRQLWHVFKIGILKIHHFIIPLILIIAAGFILKAISWAASHVIFQSAPYLEALLSILLFSWVKLCFSGIIQKI